jgi:hypothetical protein
MLWNLSALMPGGIPKPCVGDRPLVDLATFRAVERRAVGKAGEALDVAMDAR